MDLYAPDGTLVASDDNSAPDGRNALLSYTVPDGAGGTYRAVVRAAGSVGGDYTLVVSGATGQPAPFVVSNTTPAAGADLNIVPTTYQVQFSRPLLQTSIDASDLLVNGVPAAAVTQVAPDTLSFDVSALDTSDGTYTVTIPAGALTSLSGQPVTAFSSTFIIDTVLPTVASSSIQNGDVVPAGPLTYHVVFSEAMDPTGLGPQDVLLTDTYSGTSYTPSSFVYDPATNSATVTYANLPESTYELDLPSSTTAWRDLAENPLDGSGVGYPNDYVVDFSTDATTTPFPTPLQSNLPAGSLIYNTVAPGLLNNVDDTDSYTLSVDAGETITAVFTPLDPSEQATLALVSPEGSLLGSASAAAAGQPVVLETLGAATTGTYTIDVISLAGTGRYQVALTLNAAVEEAGLVPGAADSSLATAQNLDDSSVALAGAADRLAVLGAFAAPTNVALGATVIDVGNSGAFNGDLTTITNGFPYYRGAYWQDGVWWNGTSPTLEIDLGGSYVLSGANVQANSPDTYQLQYLAADGTWQDLWDVPSESSQIPYDELISRPDYPYSDGQQWHTFTPVTTTAVRFLATGGDNNYAVSQIQLLGVPAAQATDTYYQFTLAAGQAATVALTGGAGLQLSLFDSAGNLLANGAPDNSNVTAAVSDFVPQMSGVYYVRVSNDPVRRTA